VWGDRCRAFGTQLDRPTHEFELKTEPETDSESEAESGSPNDTGKRVGQAPKTEKGRRTKPRGAESKDNEEHFV